MSLDVAALTEITNREFGDPLSDLILNANPVLKGLTKRNVATADAVYLRAAESRVTKGGAIADGSDITFDGTEGTEFIRPTLPWATYMEPFSINSRALAGVSGDAQLGMLQHEIMQAAKAMSNSIAADIFKGAVSNGIVGLQAMVDDDNTYAGINRATATNWRSAVYDNSPDDLVAGELSTAAFYALDELYFAANGYGFTERSSMFTGVTDSKIITKYKGMMETIDFGSLSTAHFVNQANASNSLGIGNVGFIGMPIFRDRNIVATGDLANSSRLYVLNMEKIFLAQLIEDQKLAEVHRTVGFTESETVSGINARIKFLAPTGESIKGYVYWYGQLATANPREAGAVIKNILNN